MNARESMYANAKSLCAEQGKQLVARAPNGTFSLFMRAYWPEKAILDGTWMPPKVESVK